MPIAIAGGGIGGLACALALANRSFSTVVCERASEFGQVGLGLQIAPNALSVLDALGVGDVVKEKALLIERMLMVDAVSGDTICDIPCGPRFESLLEIPTHLRIVPTFTARYWMRVANLETGLNCAPTVQ